MPEPEWKAELRWMAEAFAATDFMGHPVAPPEVQGAVSRYLIGTVMPHIDAAYERGLMAGRSQSGYATRRKRKEDPCPTAAPSAGTPSPASSTEGDE